MFNRNIHVELNNWKSKINRKPLILRGVRQVGKTTVVKQFSKSFDTYLSLNLEITADKELIESTDHIPILIEQIHFHCKKRQTQVPRSVNGLKIPELHYKIIVDVSADQPRGMAFIMPNKKPDQRLSNYVVSIDSLERLTGLNFFPLLSKEMEELIEGKADFEAWKTQAKEGDVEPFKATELPKGHFNTEQARLKVGQTVTIVGKVVSTKFLDKSQATFLNLDQSFPNQMFTVIIWKDGRRNFSYQPEVELDGKYIAVTGKVELDKNGVPGITVTKESQIEIWE